VSFGKQGGAVGLTRVCRWTPVLTAGALAALAGMAGAVAAVAGPAVGQANGAKGTTLTVCQHGCRYGTIQSAVDHSRRGATIGVKPGKYVEGVVISGHAHDGLRIIGLGKKPAAVLLEGRNAHGPGGAAQNGIAGDNVDNLVLENMKAEHYVANGFLIDGCRGYLMRNLIAGFDRAYGLYAFGCVGGRMTRSVAYGHGDSAFYVGGTPPQKHPQTTTLDHLIAYKNVFGFSGSNSKYMVIRDSEFYDNGAGLMPNTWKPEPNQPASDGVIEHNLIYWNNFDYFRRSSPVTTNNFDVKGDDRNFPVGAGVVLFGVSRWTVRRNAIFGNFLWGGAAFSDPTNDTGEAISVDNRFVDNKMGGAFHDANGTDFFNDGSGSGTCFAANGAVTVDALNTGANLYPTCPSTAGTGTVNGDRAQALKLSAIAGAKPPTKQESYWHVHSHPARKDRKPYEG
jgi:Right handed beta helix region